MLSFRFRYAHIHNTIIHNGCIWQQSVECFSISAQRVTNKRCEQRRSEKKPIWWNHRERKRVKSDLINVLKCYMWKQCQIFTLKNWEFHFNTHVWFDKELLDLLRLIRAKKKDKKNLVLFNAWLWVHCTVFLCVFPCMRICQNKFFKWEYSNNVFIAQ